MKPGVQRQIILVSSGDLRLSANQNCWAAQVDMENNLTAAIEKLGWSVKRGHLYNSDKKHGFIDSQRMGMDVFRDIDPNQPLIVAESVWQYSHHVLAGLTTHRGPILTVANWSGQWPGLVGMLNLNGCLTKAEIDYSTLWSENFDDDFFVEGLQEWLATGKISYDQSHVKSFSLSKIPQSDEKKGRLFARNLRDRKVIMGVFDEGCMGMYNAIIPDELLHKTGFFKERLSQSALYAAMLTVTDQEAEAVLKWLLDKGMKFNWGSNEETELTQSQTLEQCKMYIAALRIADDFKCDTIGIQYQQGLKDLTVASDLVEGLLNHSDRPPVFSVDGRELYAKKALPHFNEVDECAGLDALVTYQLWNEMGMTGENTLHDIRWGQHYKGEGIDDFVWLFLISGAAPAAHFVDGYAGAGEVVALPKEETDRRWNETTPEWPIMHAVLKGVTRDQMMARHKANHIHVVYANYEANAHEACRIKAAAMDELGIKVHFCGDVHLGKTNSIIK
ncbi:MAG: fucose isomerase [Pedobacter sp.]|nr:MAG: fucose isomerase [Pedobacter sp.]